MAELNTLARPYARAVFESALEQDAVAFWSDKLSHLSRVVQTSEVVRLLDHPGIMPQQKAQVLLDVLGDDQATPEMQPFVDTLAEYGRLALVPVIAELYENLRAEHEKAVEVVVTSAYDLSTEQQESLREALARRLDRRVDLESKTDSSLLGGVHIQAGDTVIDASLRGRLNRLAQTMNS